MIISKTIKSIFLHRAEGNSHDDNKYCERFDYEKYFIKEESVM